MVISNQLGNFIVTYTRYLMKYTKRTFSNVPLTVQTAKEQSGETKRKEKKEQKIFDRGRPVFRSDRSINWREHTNCSPVLSLDHESNQAKFANTKEETVYPFRRDTSCTQRISSFYDFTFIFFLLAEIPRVVQTQGTAGEESGEHEDDDDDRGYDGRAGE